MDGQQMITVDELARRFGKSRQWAGRFIRRIRHVKDGANVWTTEEWLAEWMAEKSIAPEVSRKMTLNLDPLDAFIMAKTVELVGNLARAGKLRVQMA